MASTRNINTSHDYRRAQCEKRHFYQLNLEKRDAKPDVCAFPKAGVLFDKMPGGYNNNTLSNNAADIESFLFGIGSTNLAKPLVLPKPSMNNLKSVPFFENSATIVPNPLVIEREQRPVIFRR
tara:strand:+ start:78 stop:446 length:369 start_codon:yes stop_codon:yes gene_type:complete